MKQRYLSILTMAIVLLLAGCDIHRSDNGDLDGLWQMTTEENLTTGEVSDGRDAKVTWGIQGALVELRAYDAPVVFAKFEHTDNSLVLRDICFSGRHDSDWATPSACKKYLKRFAIPNASSIKKMKRHE